MRRASVAGSGSLTRLPYPCPTGPATRPPRGLFPLIGRLVEPCAGKRGEDLAPRSALLVPGEGDIAEQVRVRRLEPLVATKRGGEPADAALAAHPGHADRLGHDAHARHCRCGRPSISARPACP